MIHQAVAQALASVADPTSREATSRLASFQRYLTCSVQLCLWYLSPKRKNIELRHSLFRDFQKRSNHPGDQSTVLENRSARWKVASAMEPKVVSRKTQTDRSDFSRFQRTLLHSRGVLRLSKWVKTGVKCDKIVIEKWLNIGHFLVGNAGSQMVKRNPPLSEMRHGRSNNRTVNPKQGPSA